MHKHLTLLVALLLSFIAHSQIKGTVKSTDGQPIPFVSIALENTYNGTSANNDGAYELALTKTGSYTVVFQSIGFKSKKVPINVTALPHTLNVVLENESYQLQEVIVSNKDNPANAIIKQAIAHREENLKKTARFEADFYSKGVFKAKNIPKRIMGMKLEVPEGSLDSTGSGIISLSETVSHISFEHPNNLKEKIIASKMSGQSSEYSYNSAREAQYNFYDDYLEFADAETRLISPIGKNAFAYYKYTLEGSFFDGHNNQVNKIKVTSRRDKEPTFDGYIYIVDDSWALYAVEVSVKGYRLRQPAMKSLAVQQTYTYNPENKIWSKTLQTFDIEAGLFGMGVHGHYTQVYSNYTFPEKFDEGTFKYRFADFEKDASKKGNEYWETNRPVPLSTEERGDYTKKDSIYAKKIVTANNDSILKKKNKFKIWNVLDGYTYSKPQRYFKYDGVLDLPNHNTVQGWNLGTKIAMVLTDTVRKRSLSPTAYFNYGIAEDRLRVWGELPLRIGKRTFNFAGGNRIEQFNPSEPISPLFNSISTLFFKDNYMKLYDKRFARVTHDFSLLKKLGMHAGLEYSKRRALFNNTDYVIFKDSEPFTSNNPLEPYNYTSEPFVEHSLAKARISASYRFKRDNYSYYRQNDNKNYNAVTDGVDPGLFLTYEKAFAGDVKQYNYDFVAFRATYTTTVDDKGDFGVNFKAGKFFGADRIAFPDFKHFNGNQTHVSISENYLNVFNLLPYYSLSTNNSFVELHAEHNFKGYIMNKVPLLDSLLWDLVIGYHGLTTPENKPYNEFTVGFDNVGFGAFRFLRVDYVRAYQGGFVRDGVVFGLKFMM